MTSRLLALLLSCVIGSPNCWCCQSHAVAAAEAEGHSCCDETKSACGAVALANAASNNDGKACACVAHLGQRDLPAGKVLLSAMFAGPIRTASDILSNLLPAPTMARQSRALVDEDPPWWKTELYLRDCRLLL